MKKGEIKKTEKQLTPLQAIRRQCLFCMNGQAAEIQKCPSTICFFYSYRFNKNESDPRKSALQAIKAYCKDCSGNNSAEVRRCDFTECSLYPFRFGKNPYIKKKGNPEALLKWRESHKT